MDEPVDAALRSAASQGRYVNLRDLGEPEAAVAALVAMAPDPLAPLAAQALSEALTLNAAHGLDSAIRAFASALSTQPSVLALQDTADILLSGPTSNVAGPALYDAMFLDLDQRIVDAPCLAAARLEVALRVALTGLVRPYKVLDRLADDPAGRPDDYLDALPRLIGIALERWPGDESLASPLAETLRALLSTTAGPEATHELACRRMREALSSPIAREAIDGLAEAREMFAKADELEERDDSRAYGTACGAVIAFAAGDAEALATGASALSEVLSRRGAWHLGYHEPAWRRGSRHAEMAWLGLVMDLRHAAERLAEPSWLDAQAAVCQLAAVYEAERSIAPAPGLVATLRPVLVSSVAASAALLGQLERMVEIDQVRSAPVLPPAARVILEAAHRARHEGTDVGNGSEDDRDLAIGRVRRLAPSLLVLGDDVCAQLGALTDKALAEAESVAEPMVARRMADHPTLTPLRDQIVARLEVNPRFVGEARAAMTVLLERTLTFLLDRYDRGRPLLPGGKDIIARIPTGGTRPVEADLQYEFYVWLAAPWEFAGRVRTEVSDVSTGRVDVTVRFGEIELVTEVKRELVNASAGELERKYLAQAAQYSGSGEPFSQLLVLDLTDHMTGIRPLSDLAWVARRQVDSEASMQHVVVAVVVGNRPTPRELRPLPRDATPRDARETSADG